MKIKFVKAFNKESYYYRMGDFSKVRKDSQGREYKYVGSIDKHRNFGWKTLQILKIIGLGCLIIPLIVPKSKKNLKLRLHEISSHKEEVRYFVPADSIKIQESEEVEEMKTESCKEDIELTEEDVESSEEKVPHSEENAESQDILIQNRKMKNLLRSSIEEFLKFSGLKQDKIQIKKGTIFAEMVFGVKPYRFAMSLKEPENPKRDVERIVSKIESSLNPNKKFCVEVSLAVVYRELNGQSFGYILRISNDRDLWESGVLQVNVDSFLRNIEKMGIEDPSNLLDL